MRAEAEMEISPPSPRQLPAPQVADYRSSPQMKVRRFPAARTSLLNVL